VPAEDLLLGPRDDDRFHIWIHGTSAMVMMNE